MSSSVELDQHFTEKELAINLLNLLNDLYPLSSFNRLIEPSAGGGSFSTEMRELHSNVDAYDIDPKLDYIIEHDFLTAPINETGSTATVGNPPFGYRAQTAIYFFNKAAKFSSVIAMIVPKSFRKSYVINQLDSGFHLVKDIGLDIGSFETTTNVRTCFQIWERRMISRKKITHDKSSLDFKVVGQGKKFKAENADFAIRRTGWKNTGETKDIKDALPITQFIFVKALGIDSDQLRKRFDQMPLTCAMNTAMAPTFTVGELYDEYNNKYTSNNTLKEFLS